MKQGGLARAVALALLAMVALPAGTAQAHPHVWVEVATTVRYENGRVTGLMHTWTFDDMYTAMAIEGLDANGDGVYSKEELADLAKVNMEGLKDFHYFTYAKLGMTPVKLKEPVDYWLEYKDNVLALHFTLPLDEPIPAETAGFTFQVYDESFFIAFNFKKDDPVKVSDGAPAGCAANLAVPEKDLEQLQALNQAFGGQMTAGNANMGAGLGYSQVVTLSCKTP